MRVVRETLLNAVLRDGAALDLHAAAFALGGRAVLIAGDKGSGKTTFLLHAMASAGADLVANDRVLVEIDDSRADATGVPTIVTIRPRTLDLLPFLRRHADERPASLLESELASGGGFPEGESVPTRDFALAPSQLAARVGRLRVRGGPVACVIFPVVSAEARARECRRLSGTDAVERLRRCFYGSRAVLRPRTVFESWSDWNARLDDQAAMAELLAARVPCVECHLGLDAYRSDANWLLTLLASCEGGR